MTDYYANLIVFLLLAVIIFGILASLNMLFGGVVISAFLSKLKNNSGNFSTAHILAIFAFFIVLYFLFYYLFKTKTTKRSSLTRSAE
jgi:hypothetical protein